MRAGLRQLRGLAAGCRAQVRDGLARDIAEQARRNSPLLNLPTRATKLIIAYGSDKLPELKRQSREFGTVWSARGLPGEMIEVAGCHHYAVLEQLVQPDGVLAKALAACAGDRYELMTMPGDERI